MIQKLSKKSRPPKSLTVSLKKTGGRNNVGRMTVRTRGGGAKKIWRKVNFGQEKMDMVGRIERFDYDPNRGAYLALVKYQDETFGYVLAPQDVSIGDEIITSEKVEKKAGNRTRLKNIQVGTQVYNVSMQPNGDGKMVRSAGTSAVILAQEGNYTHLKMPSREVRKINKDCFASIGEISNPEHQYKKIGKAGTSRRMGRRPVVRGKAKNPVDHPHGGGEGGTGIGMKYPKTKTGRHALGVKTRKRKATNVYIIKRRTKKKRK